jgi:membrane protease subunit HflC
MRKNRLTVAVAVLIVVVLLLQLVAFRVKETERAVVKTFGKATRDVEAPGLYWKWPWPIEEVVRQDARLRVLEGPLDETTTEDRKSVLVSCFVTWKPGKPVEFLERHATEKDAERTLEGLLRSTQAAVIGRHPFSALIAQDRAQLRWDDLEKEIGDSLTKKARESYAIDVVFVGIRRLALPKDTTDHVFARMRAEREEKAQTLLAQGASEAQLIRDQAEAERRDKVNAAEVDAELERARALRLSEAAYKVFEQQPDLAIELAKHEALKKALADKRTTLVFDLSTAPFDMLKSVAAVGSK